MDNHLVNTNNNSNDKGLLVIAAGLFRSGTLSLKKAFEILGYGKCYHMWEFFSNPSHANVWNDVVDNKENIDWDSLFEGYHSACDNPVAIHLEKILKKYPNAKVVLNIRDFEEWYDSSLRTVFTDKFNINEVFPHFAKTNEYFIKQINNDPFNKENMLNYYNSHCNFVRNIVSKENLLDNYNVKQGWKPLCEFLNKEVPNVDFPNINNTEEYFESINKFVKANESNKNN